jgi:hypothetical protein
MAPDDYDLYHKFEKNLLPANSTTICSDLGYNEYLETVTHGTLVLLVVCYSCNKIVSNT